MLQAVFTALPTQIIEFDEDGIIIDNNSDIPSLVSLIDNSPDSRLKQHVHEFFPDRLALEIDENISTLNKTRQPSSINYPIQLEDGEHWFEARFILTSEKHIIIIIQDITRYKSSEAKSQTQLNQLSALRAIDRSITSSVDLNLTLSMLVTQLVDHLNIDAAAILLWNAESERLEYATGLGFRTKALKHTILRLGEGYAGIAAKERRIVHKNNLTTETSDFLRSPSFDKEKFSSYYGLPLIAKGKILGVLEVFNRSPRTSDADWLGFMEMLSSQAAIAIDNASLFGHVQRSNSEITSAYDATINGWSRALDMRDKETEGHTKRVIKRTLQLAHKLGIPKSDLIHIRRGAALHDIGKMGIPDRILHKPGPLTEVEWEIMRQHPQSAYDLLSPIEYLRPALDIPYYHHERWDGSGYPFGLKADEIPIAARLFAVIDVYDALTSDRPYRSAWSDQAAIYYIDEQAGILFDLKITNTFLNII
ncbi:MAG: HD-GYP domain-containing protein [Anaerolineae bacterium]|nr:HD-GYP domain-containing protein [Anaerolineae bacterium]MDK1081267.1 HD-GYP domain-containing protein [Anaerolineae bacterium]